MELEEQLNKILSDPESMAQIMSIARSLGASPGTGPAQDGSESAGPSPADSQAMFNIVHRVQEAGQANQKQQALFEALKPFVSPAHRQRLDKALKLSKLSHMAGYALKELDIKDTTQNE